MACHGSCAYIHSAPNSTTKEDASPGVHRNASAVLNLAVPGHFFPKQFARTVEFRDVQIAVSVARHGPVSKIDCPDKRSRQEYVSCGVDDGCCGNDVTTVPKRL